MYPHPLDREGIWNRAGLTDIPSMAWQGPPRQGPRGGKNYFFIQVLVRWLDLCLPVAFQKSLCSEGTSWLPNEYSHQNKNSIPPFLDERYAAADRALRNAAE